jgi:hypothetical protein
MDSSIADRGFLFGEASDVCFRQELDVSVPSEGCEEMIQADSACRKDSGERIGLVLTASQAVEIYRCKLRFRHPKTFQSSLLSVESRIKGQSVPVAEMFGVSPKTVRDIWNRRTWAFTTAHLWTEEADDTVPVKLVSSHVNLNITGHAPKINCTARTALDISWSSYKNSPNTMNAARADGVVDAGRARLSADALPAPQLARRPAQGPGRPAILR